MSDSDSDGEGRGSWSDMLSPEERERQRREREESRRVLSELKAVLGFRASEGERMKRKQLLFNDQGLTKAGVTDILGMRWIFLCEMSDSEFLLMLGMTFSKTYTYSHVFNPTKLRIPCTVIELALTNCTHLSFEL